MDLQLIMVSKINRQETYRNAMCIMLQYKISELLRFSKHSEKDTIPQILAAQ